jgi:hypothetical protein
MTYMHLADFTATINSATNLEQTGHGVVME